MTPLDISNIAFLAIAVNSKGARTLPALQKDGTSVTWQIAEPLEVAFEPSAYNDAENVATRVTLCVTPTDEVYESISALDEWCIQTLSANPVPLLGLQLSPEQVRERYVSPLKTSEKGGYRSLRLKMNRSGRYALQCYTPEREKCPHPETWRGCSVQLSVTLKGLFLMGREYGPVLEATHVILHESKDAACPF